MGRETRHVLLQAVCDQDDVVPEVGPEIFAIEEAFLAAVVLAAARQKLTPVLAFDARKQGSLTRAKLALILSKSSSEEKKPT